MNETTFLKELFLEVVSVSLTLSLSYFTVSAPASLRVCRFSLYYSSNFLQGNYKDSLGLRIEQYIIWCIWGLRGIKTHQTVTSPADPEFRRLHLPGQTLKNQKRKMLRPVHNLQQLKETARKRSRNSLSQAAASHRLKAM